MNEMGGLLKGFFEWGKPLLAIIAALFFAFKFYYDAQNTTTRMSVIEDRLGLVLQQAQDNSRKMELGFVQMNAKIERNRDDIALYIKRTIGGYVVSN